MNRCLISIIALLLIVLTGAPLCAQRLDGNAEISFIENRGQIADADGRARPDILFIAEASGMRIYFRRDGVSYVFARAESGDMRQLPKVSATGSIGNDAGTALLSSRLTLHRMDVLFAGARRSVRVTAEDERPERYNFYYPHCPQGVIGARAYRSITYHDLYPNVDMIFHASGSGLKYDFIVHPGGDVGAIRLEYRGADSLRMTSAGSLRAITPLGATIDGRPVSWTVAKRRSGPSASTEPVRHTVPIRYRLTGNRLELEAGIYRRASTLVIDPSLQWSTFAEQGDTIVATSTEQAANNNVGCDRAGNALLATSVAGWNYVTTAGANIGNWDVRVIKMAPDGTRRWIIYFGGSSGEANGGVAVDRDGGVFVGGVTSSADLPITPSAFQRNIGAYGVSDAFLAKFDSSGRLVWDTFYGGPSLEFASQVALDSTGSIILTGVTESTGSTMSTPDAFQTASPGEIANYVARFSSTGQRLWSTYLGSSVIPGLFISPCVDRRGNIYVAGVAPEWSFPTTFKLFPAIVQYQICGFVAKLDSNGGFQWGTLVGASNFTMAVAVALDRDSDLYVLGNTLARNLPLTRGVVGRGTGRTDTTTFLLKLSTAGALVWSVGLGGSGQIWGTSMTVDTAHHITIAGYTASPDFPVTDDAEQRNLRGASDAFMAQFDQAGRYLSGTLFGGTKEDMPSGICSWGNVLYLTGYTVSQDFPLTPNAVVRINRGMAPFIAKFCNLRIPVGIDGPKALCAGGTSLLTASPGFDSYHWSTGEITRSIVGRAGGRYWLTVERFGCSFRSDTFAIAALAPPSPVIAADGPVRFCEGGSVTLDAGSGYRTYRWSTGDTTRKIVTTKKGAYTVEVTDTAACSGVSAPFDVTVDPRPDATIVVDGSLDLCEGESVTLTALPAGARYRWQDGSGNRSIVTTKAGTYRVIVTTPAGCVDTSDDVTVTVEPRPVPRIVGPVSVCAGSTISYGVADRTGDRYVWSVSGGAITAGQGTSAVTVQWGSTGAGSIAVIERTSSGCADSMRMAVIVGDRLVPVITPDGALAICEGSSVTLDAGAGYASYLWSTGASTRTISVGVAGSYSVTVTDANGCTGTSQPAAVTVSPAPRIAITPPGPIALCQGDSLALTATSGAASYLWSTGATAPAIIVRSAGSYTVTGMSGNGCTATSSVAVTMLPAPTKPSIVANGDTLTSSDAEGYRWNRDGTPIAGAISRRYVIDRPGSYTVTIDSGGCSASSDPWVRVSQPVAWLDTVSATVGDRVQLNLHLSPALRASDRASGYHVVLQLPVRGLFPYRVIDPRNGAPPSMTYGSDGTMTIDRHGLSDPITGERLLSLELEGLSTAEPLSSVGIRSVELDGIGQLPALGEGLVILSGCDVGRNVGFGKRIAILGVQPNPVKSSAVVIYRAPKGAMPVLSLLDVAGREHLLRQLGVGTGEDQTATVEIARVASGIYRLELRDGGERVSAPVIVVK